MWIPPLRALAPSVRINGATIQISKDDLSRVVGALAEVRVDAAWYLKTYPDVAAAIKSGHVKSAQAHYVSSGYFENRIPADPKVDELWYLKTNPDVARAIAAGAKKSALEHYLDGGYAEGRLPHPIRAVKK